MATFMGAYMRREPRGNGVLRFNEYPVRSGGGSRVRLVTACSGRVVWQAPNNRARLGESLTTSKCC